MVGTLHENGGSLGNSTIFFISMLMKVFCSYELLWRSAKKAGAQVVVVVPRTRCQYIARNRLGDFYNHSHGRTHSWRFSTCYKMRAEEGSVLKAICICIFVWLFLFERSEFLIVTCKKKKTDRLSVCTHNLLVLVWKNCLGSSVGYQRAPGWF